MRVALRPLLLGTGLLVWSMMVWASDKSDGGAIYKQKCSMCHGVEGKGFSAIKTPDFTDAKWQASIKDKEMIEVIKNGKKGTAMPAYADKLKEDEIQAVVVHIRSLNSEKK